MAELAFELIDEATFDAIPRPGAAGRPLPDVRLLGADRRGPGCAAAGRDRCQRARGARSASASSPRGASPARTPCSPIARDAVERVAIGYAQFGPLSAYPRAQVIRDRYPQLPESPAPWVITCLQVGRRRGRPHRRRRPARSRRSAPISTVAASPPSRRIPNALPTAGCRRPARHRSTRRPALDGRPATTDSRSIGASSPARPMRTPGRGSCAPAGRMTRARTGRCRCRRNGTPTTSSAFHPRSRSARIRSATTDRILLSRVWHVWGACKNSCGSPVV